MLRGQNRQDRQLPSAVWEGLASRGSCKSMPRIQCRTPPPRQATQADLARIDPRSGEVGREIDRAADLMIRGIVDPETMRERKAQQSGETTKRYQRDLATDLAKALRGRSDIPGEAAALRGFGRRNCHPCRERQGRALAGRGQRTPGGTH